MSSSLAASGTAPGTSVLGGGAAGSYSDTPPLSRSLDRALGLDADAMSEGAGGGSVAKGSVATEREESSATATGAAGSADPSWICSLNSLTPSASATVTVSGYIQGVALENSRDKILFLVSIAHDISAPSTSDTDPNRAKQPAQMALSHHVVKKRFKQFRSLHTVLCQCDERFNAVLFPATSKKVDVDSGEEFDSGDPLADAAGRETVTMNRSKVSEQPYPVIICHSHMRWLAHQRVK
jgi:hypothetical protein